MGVTLLEAKIAVEMYLGEYYAGKRPEGDAIASVGYQRIDQRNNWEMVIGLREIIDTPERLTEYYLSTPVRYEFRIGQRKLF